MRKSKIGALAFVVTVFVIAQVAVGQAVTPQPTQKPTNVKQGHPRRLPQQQAQQPQPQQTQQPQLPQQPSLPQPQKKQQARAGHRSTPPPTVMSFDVAQQRCERERHPQVWWTQHYAIIVLVGGGYYYFDSGYWFPARGYDPNYEAYDYDGPIYTYGNLLPDQVILNVQRALTDLGYFAGALSGSLSPATRNAISAYQQDNGLVANGLVDAPLVYSLGLQ